MSDRRWHQGDRGPAAAFAVSAASALALAVVYALGGQSQWEGVLLAVSLGGIGIGLAVWARRFMPPGPVEEPRGSMASSEEDVQAFLRDLYVEGADGEMARRGFLAKMLVGALGALGLAALYPIRSLGPRPGRGLKTTPFAAGDIRLVDATGMPIKADAVAADSIINAFPDGNLDTADAPALVIRLRPGANRPRQGRQDWAVGDVVAYSKLCTHLGCPVGLYQAPAGLLLCPCHQSTFDVADGCRPVFGPATRSLPQLPIAVDADGYLVARGDFSSPVGAGFWDRER